MDAKDSSDTTRFPLRFDRSERVVAVIVVILVVLMALAIAHYVGG